MWLALPSRLGDVLEHSEGRRNQYEQALFSFSKCAYDHCCHPWTTDSGFSIFRCRHIPVTPQVESKCLVMDTGCITAASSSEEPSLSDCPATGFCGSPLNRQPPTSHATPRNLLLSLCLSYWLCSEEPLLIHLALHSRGRNRQNQKVKPYFSGTRMYLGDRGRKIRCSRSFFLLTQRFLRAAWAI